MMVVAAVSLVRNLVAVVSIVVGVVSLVVEVASLVVAVASLVVAVASLVVAVVSLVILLVVELFPVKKTIAQKPFKCVFIVVIGEIIRCRNWGTGGTCPSNQFSHTSHNLKHYRLAIK